MKSRIDIWDSEEKKTETKRRGYTECRSNLFSPYAEGKKLGMDAIRAFENESKSDH